MIDINSLIIFIAFGVTVLVLLAIIIRLGLRLKKAVSLYVQQVLENGIHQEQLLKLTSEKTLEQNENFVKFLSESRDWAFNYIEEVQESIASIKLTTENGFATQEELDKLFSFLPENKESNNE
jgi:hypothetical protein